jgi:hypothetical protein
MEDLPPLFRAIRLDHKELFGGDSKELFGDGSDGEAPKLFDVSLQGNHDNNQLNYFWETEDLAPNDCWTYEDLRFTTQSDMQRELPAFCQLGAIASDRKLWYIITEGWLLCRCM